MGLTLSYSVIPASPFHTLQYHMNRGVKQKFFDSKINRDVWNSNLTELSHSLKIIGQIPASYSVCILPSKKYAGIILQHLFPPGIFLYPGRPFISYPPSLELMDSGLNERIQDPDENIVIKKNIDYGNIICQETDLISGYSFCIQDIVSLNAQNPEIHLCLDISTSITNSRFSFDLVDSYLFDSEFVFGMQPGIAVFIVQDQFFHSIRQKWTDEFYVPEIKTAPDYPDILCHRETDPLKLYVFKEMCNDLVRRDLKIIRNEIIYKSILIFNALEGSKSFELMVKNVANRSSNIISARILCSYEAVQARFRHFGIKIDEIYRENYGHIIRIGNFPVHSKEQAEYLSDCIKSI